MTNVRPPLDPRLLKAAVYGANDGIITTFAVMAGVVGANLAPQIVIILGLANLFADGISMGLGDYLGERSERRLRANRATAPEAVSSHPHFPVKKHQHLPSLTGPVWQTGLVTFISFVVAGFSPIVPFVLAAAFALTYNQFVLSLITTATALFLIGSARTYFIGGQWYRNGLEMLAVGMLAASVAFALGMLTRQLIGIAI